MSWLASGVVGLLLVSNLYIIFGYAPVERTMGIVQKIFYFHVASAWIGFLAFFVVFSCGVLYLRTRRALYDQVAVASAEIGTLFTTLVLVTGPLWARPVWNTWWTWDARLTSTLVLWFMYLAYIILQHSLEGERRPRLAAVYGIVAFANVPLVFFSIRLWCSLHPVVVGTGGGGLASQMVTALMVSLVTFLALYILLLQNRVRSISLQQRVAELTQTLYGEATATSVTITTVTHNQGSSKAANPREDVL